MESKLLKADIPERLLSGPIFYPTFDVNLDTFFKTPLHSFPLHSELFSDSS